VNLELSGIGILHGLRKHYKAAFDTVPSLNTFEQFKQAPFLAAHDKTVDDVKYFH
jgi:hypothetical protein